jgi:photosystem II stability/assembly factor-like uncharacterized protein|nr:YCF48-related protein [Kofleriaceae bacterium]
MTKSLAFVLAVTAFGSFAACKKTPTGGGGGGGGWVVGKSGLMAAISDEGTLGRSYDLGSTQTLNGIACRYAGEAWVVGDDGTLLYTNDAGATWSAQEVPTTSNLRALATQDTGPVYVAGNSVFLTTSDAGAHWTSVATTASFRSLAAAQHGSTVLAVSDDGGVWSFANGALSRVTTLPGAQSVALSPDGKTAVVAGAGLALSRDGGQTWTQLAVDATLSDVNVLDDDGTAVAVGAAGAIANLSFGSVSLQHVGTADLHTVHVASSDDYDAVGVAAGDSGEVLMTHDGGWTWELATNVGRTVLGVDQIGVGHR